MPAESRQAENLNRDEAISVLLAAAADVGASVFVGNGYNARAAASLGGSPNVFYMLGSMGQCASIAAGFSRCARIPTLAIEGDGNALMGMSALPAAARAASPRFAQVVLDNGIYETTGGQRSLTSSVVMTRVAAACAYRDAQTIADAAALREAAISALSGSGPSFIHVPTARATRRHARVPLDPPQIVAHFGRWLAGARSGTGAIDRGR